MKPNKDAKKGDKIVAIRDSYGFQGRYWKKDQTGTINTDKEAKKLPKHFTTFTVGDIKSDEKSKEKKEADDKEKLAAEQAVKDADKKAKAEAKKEAEDKAAEKERQAAAKNK